MLINIIDKNCVKILLFLAISPGSRYMRKEIKEYTKMNNVLLDIALTKLNLLKMINKDRKIYSLNLENSVIKLILEERKKIARLPIRIQFIILESVETISRFKKIKNIILFGSYSKIVFHENSDIDLAIIIEDRLESKIELERQIFPLLKRLSKKYRKEIEAHYFHESDLKHKEDPLIKDILRNGISLI